VAVELRTGLVRSTKLVNPAVIKAQAFGFNGWTISPEVNPGADLSEVLQIYAYWLFAMPTIKYKWQRYT
jgi:hypothetical protein